MWFFAENDNYSEKVLLCNGSRGRRVQNDNINGDLPIIQNDEKNEKDEESFILYIV